MSSRSDPILWQKFKCREKAEKLLHFLFIFFSDAIICIRDFPFQTHVINLIDVFHPVVPLSRLFPFQVNLFILTNYYYGGGLNINSIYITKVLCLSLCSYSFPLRGQPYANKLWLRMFRFPSLIQFQLDSAYYGIKMKTEGKSLLRDH